MTALCTSEKASSYGSFSRWERVRGGLQLAEVGTPHPRPLPRGEGEGGEHQHVEEDFYDLLVGRRQKICEEG
jgi:hypothetical protein